jgi:hypothetical protein
MIFAKPPSSFDFDVHISEQDGWFDTGIPVTADLQVYLVDSGSEPGQAIPYNHWLQGRIGDSIIYPARDLTVQGPIVDTWASDPSPMPSTDSTQRIPLPESAKQTLKMRIFPAGSANNIRCRVKVLIFPKDRNRPDDLTDAQQRELGELRKMELK